MLVSVAGCRSSSRSVVVLIDSDEVLALDEVDGDIERVVTVLGHEYMGSIAGESVAGENVLL